MITLADLVELSEAIINSVRSELQKQYEMMVKGLIAVDTPHVLWAYPVARQSKNFDEFVKNLKTVVTNILDRARLKPSKGRLNFSWAEGWCSCGYGPKIVPFIDLITEEGTVRHWSSGLCPLGVITNFTLKNVSGIIVLASRRIKVSVEGMEEVMPDGIDGSILVRSKGDKAPSLHEIKKILEESGAEIYYISQGGSYNTELLYDETKYTFFF